MLLDGVEGENAEGMILRVLGFSFQSSWESKVIEIENTYKFFLKRCALHLVTSVWQCFPYILLGQSLLLPKVITPMQSKSDLESVVKHMLEEYVVLHLLLSKKLAPGHHQGSGGGWTTAVPHFAGKSGCVGNHLKHHTSSPNRSMAGAMKDIMDCSSL